MNIKIRNTWHYNGKCNGNDCWDWTAFLDDGGSGELSDVKYVEYILHPTYRQPMQKITNPQGGFVLQSSGYGTFELKAFVFFKDGIMLKLTHVLYLNQIQYTVNYK